MASEVIFINISILKLLLLYIFITYDRNYFLFIVFIDSCLIFLATMVIIGS